MTFILIGLGVLAGLAGLGIWVLVLHSRDQAQPLSFVG